MAGEQDGRGVNCTGHWRPKSWSIQAGEGLEGLLRAMAKHRGGGGVQEYRVAI